MGQLELDILKHLSRARRNSPTQCPLALAMKDATAAYKSEHGTVAEVAIHGDVMTLKWSDGTAETIKIPYDLSEAIRHYDETGDWPSTALEITLLDSFDAQMQNLLYPATRGGNYKRTA